MPTRTHKIYGKVWGDPASPATLTVTYNGEQVFSGPVNTVLGTYDPELPRDQFDFLATWTGDSSVSGNIPVSISVNGGTMHFQDIFMNELTQERAIELKPDAVWPGYAPSTLEEIYHDRYLLSDEEFQTKYSSPKSLIYSVTNITTLTPISEWFRPPTGITTETDGKENVLIDGVDMSRPKPLTTTGSWAYKIPSGSTMTYTQKVDARATPNWPT